MSTELLTRLAEDPGAAALFLDVDGVLAPIVARPEDARVPDDVRAELRRLSARYRLVACVTGRTSAQAAEVVGVPELRFVGEHGLELEPPPAQYADEIHRFAEETGWPYVERKPLSAVLHYRRSADHEAARRQLEAIAAEAQKRGLRTRFGRLVLELLPPTAVTKGTGVRRLLAESGVDRALYAGDDTTDLDGFAALDGLELAIRVAVASPESPQALREHADIVVDSPAAFAVLLRNL
jgi:trehalose 6-phosphate phosphatase